VGKQIKDEQRTTEAEVTKQRMRNREFDLVSNLLQELEESTVQTFELLLEMRNEELEEHAGLERTELRAHRLAEREPRVGQAKEKMRSDVMKFKAKTNDKLLHQIK
jgi:hypothetical protein